MSVVRRRLPRRPRRQPGLELRRELVAGLRDVAQLVARDAVAVVHRVHAALAERGRQLAQRNDAHAALALGQAVDAALAAFEREHGGGPRQRVAGRPTTRAMTCAIVTA